MPPSRHTRIPSGLVGVDTGAAYSAAVVAGDLCFVSGQLPLDPDTGALVGDSVADETRQVLRNLFAVLDAAGFAPSEIVSVLVMLADIGDWGEFDAAYRDVVEPYGLPARMAVGDGG